MKLSNDDQPVVEPQPADPIQAPRFRSSANIVSVEPTPERKVWLEQKGCVPKFDLGEWREASSIIRGFAQRLYAMEGKEGQSPREVRANNKREVQKLQNAADALHQHMPKKAEWAHARTGYIDQMAHYFRSVLGSESRNQVQKQVSRARQEALDAGQPFDEQAARKQAQSSVPTADAIHAEVHRLEQALLKVSRRIDVRSPGHAGKHTEQLTGSQPASNGCAR